MKKLDLSKQLQQQQQQAEEAQNNNEEAYDIFIIGKSKVGKSSLSTQLRKGFFVTDFVDDHTVSHTAHISVDGQFPPTTLHLHELSMTEALEEFLKEKNINSPKSAFMLVYSVDDRSSFESIPETYRTLHGISKELQDSVQQLGALADQSITETHSLVSEECGLACVLVGNKVDLGDEYQRVTSEEAQELASKLQMSFFETSAKSGENVGELFEEVVRLLRMSQTQMTPRATESQLPSTPRLRRMGSKQDALSTTDDNNNKNGGKRTRKRRIIFKLINKIRRKPSV